MKHKRKDRPVEKMVNFPQSVVDRVNEQLKDPLTGRPSYGAWSHLIVSLLNKWLAGEVKVTIPLRKKRTLENIL